MKIKTATNVISVNRKSVKLANGKTITAQGFTSTKTNKTTIHLSDLAIRRTMKAQGKSSKQITKHLEANQEDINNKVQQLWNSTHDYDNVTRRYRRTESTNYITETFTVRTKKV